MLSEGPQGGPGGTTTEESAPALPESGGPNATAADDGRQGPAGRGARRVASGPPGSRGAGGPSRRRRVGDAPTTLLPDEEPATPLSDLDVMAAIWTSQLRDGTGSALVCPETRRVRALYGSGWTDERILDTVRAALQAGWTLHDTEGADVSLRALICPPAEEGILYRAIGPPGERGGTIPAPSGPQLPLPRTAIVWPHQSGDRWRSCALLSLCGGSGSCRLAFQDLLKHHMRRLVLVASAFAEIDANLAQAVADFWQAGGGMRQADGSPWPPHQWIAGDVWDLFRPDQRDPDGRTLLQCFADSLPSGTLVVIISGWPCTDLTTLNTWGGWPGLQGPRSWLFFSILLAKTEVEARRPDVIVHAVGENVATMRPQHLEVVIACFGGGRECLMVIDSGEWTVCPRVRNWFATFRTPRNDGEVMRFHPLPSPWEPGWAFPLQGRVPTWTRSRERAPGEIRIPNYQAHPCYVMYYMDHPIYRWDLMTLFEIPRRIKLILGDPDLGYLQSHPQAGKGLQWILERKEKKYEHEAACDEYTDWLHEHGREHAIRPPNEWERARAAGLERYFVALRLEGRRLYDVVGLAFDPRALQRRLCPLLRDWDEGLSPRPPPCPSLSEVVTLYRSLDHVVRTYAPFAPREPDPFPPDLMPTPPQAAGASHDGTRAGADPEASGGLLPTQGAPNIADGTGDPLRRTERHTATLPVQVFTGAPAAPDGGASEPSLTSRATTAANISGESARP